MAASAVPFRLLIEDEATGAIDRAVAAVKRRGQMRGGYREGDAPIVLRDGPMHGHEFATVPDGVTEICFPPRAGQPERFKDHSSRYVQADETTWVFESWYVPAARA